MVPFASPQKANLTHHNQTTTDAGIKKKKILFSLKK